MKNEVLCKFLCHNLCCVIQSQLELGITAKFWSDAPAGAPASAPTVAQVVVEVEAPVKRMVMCGA
jgi:hypothetical protein